MLKNCTSPYRSRMMQYEYKKENRKDRYKAKRDIQEGIQEYESRGQSFVFILHFL